MPLAAHIRHSLEQEATGELPEAPFLRLLSDQDVAVSVASTFWSTLAILATFFLGRVLWSRWVGLLAAAAFAVDYDTVPLASLGWRDEWVEHGEREDQLAWHGLDLDGLTERLREIHEGQPAQSLKPVG